MFSSEPALQAIAVVEVTAPCSIVSTIPAVTFFVRPKSSALITSRLTNSGLFEIRIGFSFLFE
jgi:hypothetical protein